MTEWPNPSKPKSGKCSIPDITSPETGQSPVPSEPCPSGSDKVSEQNQCLKKALAPGQQVVRGPTGAKLWHVARLASLRDARWCSMMQDDVNQECSLWDAWAAGYSLMSRSFLGNLGEISANTWRSCLSLCVPSQATQTQLPAPPFGPHKPASTRACVTECTASTCACVT